MAFKDNVNLKNACSCYQPCHKSQRAVDATCVLLCSLLLLQTVMKVGFGTGKSQEVPEAIRKAVEAAKKTLTEVLWLVQLSPHGSVQNLVS